MTTRPEEEYFARVEAEKKRKLAQEKSSLIEATQREELKRMHYMRCPKCGLELEEVVFKGVSIDKCFNCGGVYLDNGELEKLTGSESHFWDSVLSIFKA